MISANQYTALEYGGASPRSMPMLLLHGLMGHPENWQGIFPHLPDTCHATALSFPFFAEHLSLGSVPAVTQYAGGFIDHAHLDPVVIGGNSLGGHVAVNLAVQWPRRVAGLVLTGSSGIFEKSFTTVGPRPNRSWFREKMCEVFYDKVHVTDSLVDEVCEFMSSRHNTRELVRVAKSAKHDDVSDRFAQIRCPVLLIWGSNDRITPPEVAEQFHQGIPGSELHWIDRCGHAAMIEHPNHFGRIVADWWRRVIEPAMIDGPAVRRLRA